MNKLFFTFLAIIFINACTSEGGGLNLGDDGNGGGGYSGSYGSVSYGGQTYKTVVIGTQTWMAENLNYNASGSTCYNSNSSNCAKYGRMYDWATAMNLSSTCNNNSCSSQIQSKHQGICPSGWHIPTSAEWTTLANYAGGSSTAGKYLKATSGWNSSGNGTDTYGFAALPGGYGIPNSSFGNVGSVGYWWTSSESSAVYAYERNMSSSKDNVNSEYSLKRALLYIIRCVKN